MRLKATMTNNHGLKNLPSYAKGMTTRAHRSFLNIKKETEAYAAIFKREKESYENDPQLAQIADFVETTQKELEFDYEKARVAHLEFIRICG